MSNYVLYRSGASIISPALISHHPSIDDAQRSTPFSNWAQWRKPVGISSKPYGNGEHLMAWQGDSAAVASDKTLVTLAS